MGQRKEEEAKSMGSLAGIATLRRSGDVMVGDEESHKIVTSTFTVGPLQLEVSKTYGEGKARTVRTAKASTDVMSGTMVLKVKPEGQEGEGHEEEGRKEQEQEGRKEEQGDVRREEKEEGREKEGSIGEEEGRKRQKD